MTMDPTLDGGVIRFQPGEVTLDPTTGQFTRNYCSHCGSDLINEDCPRYGSGPEHAPIGGYVRALEQAVHDALGIIGATSHNVADGRLDVVQRNLDDAERVLTRRRPAHRRVEAEEGVSR